MNPFLMMRRISLLFAFLAAAVLVPAAQDANATLHTKTADGVVQVAIVIDVEHGAHLYHGPTKADLGHPDAVGAPTTVTLEGEGITFGPVWFPEPERIDQSGFGEGVYINAHEGRVVLFAAGRAAPGAGPGSVTAKVKGLVCDDSGCMPWKRTLTDAGEGPAKVWEGFPEELVADLPSQVAAPEEPFVPRQDEKTSGEADATLYTRIDPADPTHLRAAIRIEITRGWHLYHREKGNPDGIGRPTRVELGGTGIEWGEVRWPEPEKMDQSDIIEGAWIYGHEGTIVLYAEGVLGAGAKPNDARAKITGQTCEDSCVAYGEVAYTQGLGPDSVWGGWASRDATPGDGADTIGAAAATAGGARGGAGEDPEGGNQAPLGPFLLEAVLWGVITLLMPCTYPMIPITISFFTKQAESHGGRATALSVSYGLGIVLSFIAIGVLVGPAIVPFAQGGGLNFAFGILFIYFSLGLFGYFSGALPRTQMMITVAIIAIPLQLEAASPERRISYAIGFGVLIGLWVAIRICSRRFEAVRAVVGTLWAVLALPLATILIAVRALVRLVVPRTMRKILARLFAFLAPYRTVFMMGAFLVVTSFTCTAPFVGTLLARGAAHGDLMRVVLGMSVFGLTMAIPFVILSLVPGRVQALPKSGAWMNTLKVTLGFVELAAAFKFFSNSDLTWNWQVISREAFLFLWAAIFLVAALYLWGVVRLKGYREEIGMKRRGIGVLFFAFAVYCGIGGTGRPMNYVMSAFSPPYSGGRFFPSLYEFGGDWTTVEDDYLGAIAKAKEEKKLLLVNFTGHT